MKPSNHLAPFKILGVTPLGTCEQCAVAHRPDQPHNARSVLYQYKFYDEHGRWPNWKDAMAHCAPNVQQAWRDLLEKAGVDVDSGQVHRKKREVHTAK